MTCWKCGREGYASFERVDGVMGVQCVNRAACRRRIEARKVPRHVFPASPNEGND